MPDFRKLDIWKKSFQLSLKIYSATHIFPKEEIYGLTSQIRRAAISIPSNIAEGSSNRTNLDFKRFLNISLGSSFELETQLLFAKEFNYISQEKFDEIFEDLNHTQRMIQNFIKSLN